MGFYSLPTAAVLPIRRRCQSARFSGRVANRPLGLRLAWNFWVALGVRSTMPDGDRLGDVLLSYINNKWLMLSYVNNWRAVNAR